MSIVMRHMPYSNRRSSAPSTIYAIFKRHGLNRLTKPMKQSKRQIIKTRAGELGHLDCHYLSRDLIVGAKGRRYLVCVLDACTRLAWAEMVDGADRDVLHAQEHQPAELEYGVKFEAILGRWHRQPTGLGIHGEDADGVGDQTPLHPAL